MRWKKRVSMVELAPSPEAEAAPDKRLQWHRHFCWWPITVDQTRVWLETVYRKGRVVPVNGYRGYQEVIEYDYNLEGVP